MTETKPEERKSNAGRKPYDTILKFKILVLQSLQRLVHAEVVLVAEEVVASQASKRPPIGGSPGHEPCTRSLS